MNDRVHVRLLRLPLMVLVLAAFTVAGAAAIAGCSTKPEKPSGKVSPPKGEAVYFGVSDRDAPFRMPVLDSFERLAGKRVALLMWYQPWGSGGRNQFYVDVVDQVRDRGVIPVISWEPWEAPQTPGLQDRSGKAARYRLRNIIDGDFDTYIRSWAKGAREYGGPMMLRPMHEMNGFWYPWGGTANGNRPQEFVPAWRHVHDIFEKEGATNVTWVWSVNENSSPETATNDIGAYYPGDDYVDWVGISGFNWGTGDSFSTWRQMEAIYDESYGKVARYGKPVVFIEFASVEKGGDKPQWIEDSVNELPEKYPLTKAVVWYNDRELHRDFRINSTPESLSAFREAIADPRYISKPRDLR